MKAELLFLGGDGHILGTVSYRNLVCVGGLCGVDAFMNNS